MLDRSILARNFTDDLEKDIGGVKVIFRPLPDGLALGIKYFHKLHVFYTKDGNYEILGSRQQSF